MQIMKKLLPLLFVCAFLGGCKKYLTTAPQDFITPQNYFTKEQDAALALNAAFDELSRQWYYAGYWQARMVESCDDVYCTLTGQYPANHQATATDPSFASTWQVLYEAIERCNVLLANIDKVDMDATKKGYIKGEALFFRAYCFFFLVDQWGPIPLKLKPTADANDISIPRSSVADVYAQILKDMTTAEELVPTTALGDYGGAGYPAKTTVQGILARVCLTMAGEPLNDKTKFEDARKWALRVVDSKEHSLNPDYTDVFIKMISNQYAKKESMWEVDMVDVPGKTEHGYLGYLNGINCPLADTGNCVGQVRATRLLYNLYNAKDLRRDWNMAPYYYVASGSTVTRSFMSSTALYDRFPGKFRLQYTPFPRTTGRSPVNFPLLRYADVLLMLAEAENETNGPTALAYSCINQVRARGWGKLLLGATNPTESNLTAGLDQASFRQAIQDERCREFPSEGLRKHDLMRWGIFFSTLQKMKNDVNNTALPAVNSALKQIIINIADNATPKWRYWPIPANELSLNNAMTQNPGW
ncbi:MAG: RagB/SusD family nutrient uptake outer membrane protein [Chitinophagaceae bacterium]|nr:MAG: RagB/SusD family nutrient uptake outer membrane protein [Chitinophagaceae bacterium]